MTKLTWGLIGGGAGSQIGPAHRMGAALDGRYVFAAGALDVEPDRGRAFARELGVPADRAYGDWQEMLAAERARPDPVDLVTIATPNATHYAIARAFLAAGFHVLCEKPMTQTVPEAEDLVAISRAAGRMCAVNFGYSGYPLMRHARAMVARGDLGRLRLIKAEFAHGFHANADDADNPRIRWRYDPDQAGISAVFADAGIHAFHLACFVAGRRATSLCADFASLVAGRRLEDDAMLSVRLEGGALVRLWTSAVAVGRMHGLTLQIFGERGGLRWAQEQPDQLYWTPLDGGTEIIERGAAGLSPEADRAGRLAIGHAEGMPLAFANIYRDLAELITARREGRSPDPAAAHVPLAEDGLSTVRAITAAVASARQGGAWLDMSGRRI